MPPLMRFWFNLHRHNTRPLKDRNMHKLERALIIWPLHAYMWVKRRRTPAQTIKAPEGAFFNAQNQEDTWLLT